MKTQEFTARTKTGVEITITAENTPDELKTTYPIKCVPVQKVATYVVTLNAKQTKELVGIDLPAKMPFAAVPLSDQDGWRDFERACSYERYETKNARLEALFPGLQALQNARNAENYYHEQFERMMEDESNDGARPPKRPKERYQDLAPKYPKAVAYLKAQGYAASSNVGKFSAGKKAVERLENEEEYEAVIAEMEKEWSDYCEKHIWD